MSLIQILITAASLSAIAGGTWTVDRVMDRYGRIPIAEEPIALPVEQEEEEASARAEPAG